MVTTPATTQDEQVTETIHRALAQKNRSSAKVTL
jgi:hypothetical protein